MSSTDAVTADTDSASRPAMGMPDTQLPQAPSENAEALTKSLLSQLVTNAAAKSPAPTIADPVPVTIFTPEGRKDEEDPSVK